MQSQDYPYAKDEYKLIIAIYHTRMTILEQEMTADVVDRDAGYSWGTGVMEDKGDRGLDSS